MIDRDRQHLLRCGNSDALQLFIRHVVFHRIEHHRTNVRRSWLKEMAKEIKIVLDVPQRSGRRHKPEDARQAIHELQILMAAPVLLPVAPPRLSSYPRTDSAQQTCGLALRLCALA